MFTREMKQRMSAARGGGAPGEATTLRRIPVLRAAAALCAVALVAGCASFGGNRPRDVNVGDPAVRQPEILDHKNFQFGRDIPDWVFMEGFELEQLREYSEEYVFKFDSPRAQSLEGARLWTRNFQAAAELARTVQNRVEVKFAGSVAGDLDRVDEYQEEVVNSLSSARFSGYRPVADYWIKFRYFDTDGEVTEEAYTYYVMYTIDRDVLDQMIMDALEEADDGSGSDEQRSLRERIKNAFENGL